MTSGFLGNDASLMLDVVVCALVLLVPLLAFSLYAVKVRRNFALHRNLQIALAIILFVAVAAFEIDMRLHGGWKNIVNKDPGQPRVSEPELVAIERVLYIHLVFAITTPILWAVTIVAALRRFSRPPEPGPHSARHKLLGWAAAADLALTSATGLWFYCAAFVS